MTQEKTLDNVHSLRKMSDCNKDKIGRSTMYMVDIDELYEEVDFNVGRNYENEAEIENIRKFADIYKDGDKDQPPPLRVSVIDGRIFVRDGHCRRRGALLARSEGALIKRLPVLEVSGDEVDQTMVLLHSNDGLKLSPTGIAKVYVKLANMGLTEIEIADRARKTRSHVRQYLELNNLPLEIKKMIDNDQIAWSTALELYQDKGAKKTLDIIKNTLNKGDDKNAKNKKITRKVIAENSGYRARFTQNLICKTTDCINSLYNILENAEQKDDYFLVSLTKEDIDMLNKVKEEIDPKNEGKKKDKAVGTPVKPGKDNNVGTPVKPGKDNNVGTPIKPENEQNIGNTIKT